MTTDPIYVYMRYVIRNREQQEWKLEMRRFEERMETMREELRQERDRSQRKTSKDIGEVRTRSVGWKAKHSDCLVNELILDYQFIRTNTSPS